MSQADRRWADGADEMSIIHATLRQQRDAFAGQDDPDRGAETQTLQDPGGERRPAEPAETFPLLAPGEPLPPASWDTAIQLVEAAAARIKAYERKFKAIELDALAFIDRVDAEQRRLNGQIAGLERDLRKAEDRALAAETEVQAMRLETWEAKLSRRNAEQKLTDAELQIRTSQQYLGQIESILRGL
jgi:hypothetical protein